MNLPVDLQGVLLDHHCSFLKDVFEVAWRETSTGEVIKALNIALLTFSDAILRSTVSDSDLWDYCQQNRLLLFSNNRNWKTADALQAVIERSNLSDALPVITPDAWIDCTGIGLNKCVLR